MTSLPTTSLFVRPDGAPLEEQGWRKELQNAIRDPAELCRVLELPGSFAEGAVEASADFPLLAPQGYVARMRKGDPSDPLLRQILPLDSETRPMPGFVPDPVGDAAASLTPGVLHKYRGRALLVATGVCAVHCRYCFRRHYNYSDTPRGVEAWSNALKLISHDRSIHEAILSGGDPLSLVDETLAELSGRIAEIPHVRRLRVHTRLPIVIPQRVTDSLLDWLTGSRLTPVLVLHANHANELDDQTAWAVRRLASGGIRLLNQTVLLRGVNDSVDAQADLCERLIDLGVMPYYLHQLDRVAGAAHFEVPREEGLKIVYSLRKRLPGYAVPRYVQEIPGEPHKTLLEPTHCLETS